MSEPEREEHLTKSVVDEINEYITTKYVPRANMLVRYNYHYDRIFGTMTTSNNESENSKLKRNPTGPRANQSIDQSAKCMNDIHRKSLNNKAVTDRAALDGKYSCPELRSKHIEGLVPEASEKIIKQHELAMLRRAAEVPVELLETEGWQTVLAEHFPHLADPSVTVVRMFLVVRADDPVVDPGWHNPTHPMFYKTVVPSFIRTRVVLLIDSRHGLCLLCSCGNFEQHGFTCRYVVCLASLL